MINFDEKHTGAPMIGKVSEYSRVHVVDDSLTMLKMVRHMPLEIKFQKPDNANEASVPCCHLIKAGRLIYAASIFCPAYRTACFDRVAVQTCSLPLSPRGKRPAEG